MSKELIVSAGRHETKVAILEDDQVVELFHEREKEYSLAGSIHKGRVTRVLPGMQSAFVNIGLDRDAFLYVSDFFEDNDEYDAVVSTVEEKVLKMEKTGASAGFASSGAERPPFVRQAGASAGDLPAEALVVEAFAIAAVPVIDRASEARTSEARTGDARPVEARTVEARPGELARSSGRPERTSPGDRGPERGGERGGERGRGRRGRRRRGGRDTGGLPESKFFSPRGEATGVAAAQAAPADTKPEETIPTFSQPSAYTTTWSPKAADDFTVLPGESLAKYSSGEPESELAREPRTPAVEDASAQVAQREEIHLADVREGETGAEETQAGETHAEETRAEDIHFEAALPGEHPLAAFGLVSSWIAEEPATEETPAAMETIPVGQSEPVVVKEILVSEVFEIEEIALPSEPEDGPEPEIEEPPSEDGVPEQDPPFEDEISGEEKVSEELLPGEEPEESEPVAASAAVREQGQRYPHRVSRRMRRKQRGPQPVEDVARPAGEEKSAVAPQREDNHAEPQAQAQERVPRERVERERPPVASISDLLKEGQEIVVQIAKEPLGQKGARITSHIALPGRFVVYMPTVEHVGVSRKIPSDEERQRLKRVLQTHRQGVPGGFICRTAAENKTEEELKADMHFLYNLWLDMRQKAERKPAPVLLHHDLDLVQRILRDQLTTSFKTIWVDNEELYESVLRFVQRFQPALVGRVKLYTRSNPIFDEFGITAEVEKALRPKVWLKSGGYIVINQTEALVAIDINTGKYVGKSNRLEDTIVKINTDAIKEIVRQIRLRDLGGIIVVDFIDMDERKNRQKVMLALEEGMRADRAPYKILQFNDFGLVAITRKRVKQSLERTLCAPCAYCEGAGYIKSPATVVSEILQEAQRMQKALASETGNVVLRVNPEVAKLLKSNQNSFLQEIEEIAGRTVLVKSDPLLHQTKFDLA